MGSLNYFDIGVYIQKFGCCTLVETGTGVGQSLTYAQHFPLNHILSIEIEPALADAARTKFCDDPRITILSGTTEQCLRQLLEGPDYTPLRAAPILFWMDAHFPGADYGMRDYEAVEDARTRIPLEDDLRMVKALRGELLRKDVILVDDLRIYIDGPFQYGNLPANVRPACPRARDIDFVYDMFDATHDVKLHYAGEGYIELLPKTRA